MTPALIPVVIKSPVKLPILSCIHVLLPVWCRLSRYLETASQQIISRRRNAALQSTLHNHQGFLSKTHFCSCPSLVKSLPPHCPQKNIHVVNKACKPFPILSDLPTLPQSNLLSNYLQWLGFPESTKLFLYIPTLYLLCPLPGELLLILRDPLPISPAL